MVQQVILVFKWGTLYITTVLIVIEIYSNKLDEVYIYNIVQNIVYICTYINQGVL